MHRTTAVLLRWIPTTTRIATPPYPSRPTLLLLPVAGLLFGWLPETLTAKTPNLHYKEFTESKYVRSNRTSTLMIKNLHMHECCRDARNWSIEEKLLKPFLLNVSLMFLLEISTPTRFWDTENCLLISFLLCVRFQTDERGTMKFTTSFTSSLAEAYKLCGEKLTQYQR